MEHPPEARARAPRRRAAVAVALVVVIAAGLALQLVRHLPGSDIAGTAAYAVAAVLAVALVRPGWSVWAVAAVGTGAVCAVEVAQLTPLPGAISEAVPAARLFLGANFDPVDLIVLAVAGGFTGLLLLAGLRRVAVPS
ncbi:DUF2809 domain-containing protein [Occultella gossypii]|uniref:DUF2809 domain-containing protein n=1 Tax=Occultella gossypii TaxID=2800820 RepID=A0ABS7S6H2_9MICO|nr:DUF2809 domain-containing protein [Occultella gossypii]MBZ2195219.1 DUF2809 domain-containing protein [Occultella gossypii]